MSLVKDSMDELAEFLAFVGERFWLAELDGTPPVTASRAKPGLGKRDRIVEVGRKTKRRRSLAPGQQPEKRQFSTGGVERVDRGYEELRHPSSIV